MAGPVTIINSFIIMWGMTVWVPEGAANVNHFALPVIIFPLIWVVLFTYVCLEDNLPRGSLVMFAIAVVNLGLVALG
ncbi:MAG: hypothetical protein AAGF53_04260 [Pseudomonadota bacterium]